MANYFFLAFSISLAVAGQMLMKHGMNSFGAFPVKELPMRLFPMIFNPFVFVGLLFFCFSAISWLFILSRMQLSQVYPMVSLGYVIVVFLSWLIFKEHVSLVRWIGVSIICLGVVFISRS